MNENKEKITNLSKITLSVKAGRTRNIMDIISQPLEIEFIFGLGPEGLTPFECELADKSEGDEISLCLKQENIHKTFEHIQIPFHHFHEHPDPFYLKVQVIKTVSASNREVVKAMSQLAACGHHDCACTCA